jgi:hypothetical protein
LCAELVQAEEAGDGNGQTATQDQNDNSQDNEDRIRSGSLVILHEIPLIF